MKKDDSCKLFTQCETCCFHGCEHVDCIFLVFVGGYKRVREMHHLSLMTEVIHSSELLVTTYKSIW